MVNAETPNLPVAGEKKTACEMLGDRTRTASDAGVAGMEGVLASVVGGFLPQSIVTAPTSVGCGTAMGGLAALLGVLPSGEIGTA